MWSKKETQVPEVVPGGHATPQGEKEEQALHGFDAMVESDLDSLAMLVSARPHKAPHEDDVELKLRFLRARGLDPSKALQMMKDDSEWRVANNVLGYRLCTAQDVLGCDPQLLEARFFHGFLGYDKLNRPIVYKHYGKFLVQEMVAEKMTTLQQLINYDCWLVERSIALLPKGSQCFVAIIDLDGIGMANMGTANLRYSRGLADAGSPHYPERLGQMFIINSPWIFRSAYSLICSWVDKRTTDKVKLLGGPEVYRAEMEKFFDPDLLPTIAGGKSECGGWRSFCPEKGAGVEAEIAEITEGQEKLRLGDDGVTTA